MAEQLAIAAEGVRVVRGGTLVLDDVALAVPAGSLYGLVGPSGAGKTTLIRAIAGRQRLARGSLTVLGQTAGSAILRSQIGYMPQEPAIYLDLSARENLAFFAAIYRVPPARVDEVLELMNLRHDADRAVATYSGGQRRRVALAAALLAGPPLLLLDEPTVGLDPRLRHRLWAQFRTWAAEGTTVLVSTHVMDEAARVDCMAFILDGRIVAAGSPGELVTRTQAPDLESAVLQLTGGPA